MTADFVIPAEAMEGPMSERLSALVQIAKTHARPPISGFHVGAAALGESGRGYLGVNLEFVGHPLHQTVHAEQFLVVNALAHGERRLSMLAVSAPPCGHCRQFLNEMGGDLTILVPQGRLSLSELLPCSFGPADLGVTDGLMAPQHHALDLDDTGDALIGAALEAARGAYSPYSKSPSGMALQLEGGLVVRGRYAENAAFNPGVSPLQAALIGLVAAGRGYDEIRRAVLVERETAPVKQTAVTTALLSSLQPLVVLETVYAS